MMRSVSYVLVQLPLGFSDVTLMHVPVCVMISIEFVPNLRAALRTTQGNPNARRNSSRYSVFDSTQ